MARTCGRQSGALAFLALTRLSVTANPAPEGQEHQTYRLLSLHPDSEEFDGPGAQVTRSGVGQVAGHRVQNSPQQHAVLEDSGQL